MAHHHHDDETYFLDQICMVALSGAFGVICLSLYFLKIDDGDNPNVPVAAGTYGRMLNQLLGPQFHPFVLASGVALVVIAVLRAAMLWSQAGGKESHDARRQDQGELAVEHSHSHGINADSHEHSHSHAHSHSHGSHSHSHADAGHDAAQAIQAMASSSAFGHTPGPSPAHSHSHAHAHSHSHADHDHGWAPWRYVVLLVPIIFFLLGLPSKGPSIDPDKLKGIDAGIEDSLFAATQALLSNDVMSALGMVGAREADAITGKAEPMNVKRLEELANNPADREFYKGKVISVRGQYMPQTDRLFFLVRFRIQCCAADAIQLSIPMLAKDSIAHVKAQEWVEVTGRVDFRPDGKGGFRTAVLVSNRNHVVACNPDLNPYVQ